MYMASSNFISLIQILNRHPPFGNQIKESVIHLPKYEVTLEQVKHVPESYLRDKYIILRQVYICIL